MLNKIISKNRYYKTAAARERPELFFSYRVITNELLSIFDSEKGVKTYPDLKEFLHQLLKEPDSLFYLKKHQENKALLDLYRELYKAVAYTDAISKKLDALLVNKSFFEMHSRTPALLKLQLRHFLKEMLEIQQGIIDLWINEKRLLKPENELKKEKTRLNKKLHTLLTGYEKELANTIKEIINPQIKSESPTIALQVFSKQVGLILPPEAIKTPSKAKIRWQQSVKLIRDNQLITKEVTLGDDKLQLAPLSSFYWLEKLDPKNRNIYYLQREHAKWQKDNKSEDNFFTWLDNKNEAQTSVEYYKSSESRKQYKVFFENGVIKNHNGAVIDTTQLGGKKPGYAAFVISPSGEFLIGEHIHKKRVHASFLAGNRVVCAGMVKIVNGKIVDINNESGHYKPSIKHLLTALRQLPRDIFDKESTITYSTGLASNLGKHLTKSNLKAVKRLGDLLQTPIIPHKMTTAQFFAKHAHHQKSPVIKEHDDHPKVHGVQI